jgi:hypothetical protein
MRAASAIFGIIAVGLIGHAAYHYLTESARSPGEVLLIDSPDRDLGSQPSGLEIPVRFRLTNTSSHPIRVLGLIPG